MNYYNHYLIAMAFFLCTSTQLLQATTIVPYPNLGEMAKASPVVVLAKATQNYEVAINDATRYRTQFTVVSNIKGNISSTFSIQSMRLTKGALNRIVFGDMEYEEGATYLLFLSDRGDYWRPVMMSHAIFQQWERNGQYLLSPVEEGLNFFNFSRPDGQEVESFFVYDLKKMVKLLRNVTNGSAVWNSALAKTEYPATWFQAATRAEPSHCTFLYGPPSMASPSTRWDDFPELALPVRYGSAGEAGCPTANAKVQQVITELNNEYAGINLTDAGVHSFVPTCPNGEGANDDEFTDWIDANLGGSMRHLLVQYNDPCDEIDDLVGCSGTLAFGGLYSFSNTHTWDGVDWRTGAYGYVVVNNGTGACQCPSNAFNSMMAHEMTHTLGIGHISGSGTANMNPSCCVDISALDTECLDYTYAPAVVVPVELSKFDGALVGKTSQLEWTTVSEQNNDFFTLERSTDGRNFEALGKITGNGTTTDLQKYQYTDARPALGKNYYRLIQTDFDGRWEQAGKIVVIAFGDEGNIAIRPNPVQSAQVNLTLVATSRTTMDIQLYDMTGKVLKNKQVDLVNGKNEIQLNIADFVNGVYLLKAVVDGVVQTQRMVIAK